MRVEYNFVRHFYTGRDAPGGTLFPDLRPYTITPAPAVPSQAESIMMPTLSDVDSGRTHVLPHASDTGGMPRALARRRGSGGRHELRSACSSTNGSFSKRPGDILIVARHIAALTRCIICRRASDAAMQRMGGADTMKAAVNKLQHKRTGSITPSLEHRGLGLLFDDDADNSHGDELEHEVEAGSSSEDGDGSKNLKGDECGTRWAGGGGEMGLWESSSSLRTSLGDVEVEC